MKIIIGSDHAGFEYKEDLIGLLKEKNIEVSDLPSEILTYIKENSLY